MVTVRDIMQKEVVSVSPDTSARALARLLADQEITGVPVLDINDVLVGVVSATDLVRLAADESAVELRSSVFGAKIEALTDPDAGSDDDGDDPYGFFLPEDSPLVGQRFLDQWSDDEFDSVPVRDIMTPVSFSVTPETTVHELCEFLVRGRIHRAVVVEDARLVGIVTSADVLRAVAEAKVAVGA